MRSGSYMQFSASAKRPASSNWTSNSTSTSTPRFSNPSSPGPAPPPPAPVQQTMPVVSRNTSSLMTLPYVTVATAPSPVAGRRGGRMEYRRHWSRRCQFVHPKTLLALSFFSFCLLIYWSYVISSMAFSVDAMTPKKRLDQVDIDLNQILYAVDLIDMAKTSRTAIYVWCDDDTSFTYLNYLSIASVMRFFVPDRLLILYESRPPTITGNWLQATSDSSPPHHQQQQHEQERPPSSNGDNRLAALMTRCSKYYRGPTKMKNGTMICRSRRSRRSKSPAGDVGQSDDGRLFNEFVMRLLLQYGGLYVGQRTFMTEVANYFRLTGAVQEHLLMYRSTLDIGEGFVFVREPVVDQPSTNKSQSVSVAPGPSSRRPEGAPPGAEVRYYKSRELGCYEGRNFSVDALQLSVNQQVSMFACALMVDGTPASEPQHVIKLKSDFGRAARKSLFNIHDDWETKYYLRAVNGSLVPPMCYF